MLKGFRDFVLRGNVLDLAVAVIIGAAFTSNVSNLVLHLHGGVITYGNFINAVIAFILLAAVIYFLIVLPANRLLARINRMKAPEAATTKTCAECLSEIPLAAHRCKFCGQPAA